MKIRRFFAAIVAVAVAGFPVLAMPQPAAAAPTLCTAGEWQNPANFKKCTKSLRDELSRRVDCVQAPTPQSPTSGLAGWFTSRPDADLVKAGANNGLYTNYGLAGYRLQTYGLGCPGVITHPADTGQTAFASFLFSSAATIIGAANRLRSLAYQPGGMWTWSDSFVADTTTTIYKHVFGVFGALTLAMVGVWLLWRARHAKMSEAVSAIGWALMVMTLATAVAKWPVVAAHGADKAAATGLATMQSVLGPPPQNIPADKCVGGLFDPESCIDHRDAATRSSDAITKTVLYRNWLRAELGSADSPTAQKFGPALYDASALRWGEAADLEKNPDLREVTIQDKAEQWNAIAAQIKTADPEAYENLQGLNGDARVGAGMLAFFMAAIYSAFDMAASAVILLGFLVFRIAVILIPLLATIGIALPMSGGLRRVLNAVVASIINIIVFGGAAGIYLSLVVKVSSIDALPGPVQLLAVALIGAACLMLTRPIRRAMHIIRLPKRERPERNGRLAAFLARIVAAASTAAANQAANQASAPTARQHGAGPGPGGARVAVEARPETLTRSGV